MGSGSGRARGRASLPPRPPRGSAPRPPRGSAAAEGAQAAGQGGNGSQRREEQRRRGGSTVGAVAIDVALLAGLHDVEALSLHHLVQAPQLVRAGHDAGDALALGVAVVLVGPQCGPDHFVDDLVPVNFVVRARVALVRLAPEDLARQEALAGGRGAALAFGSLGKHWAGGGQESQQPGRTREAEHGNGGGAAQRGRRKRAFSPRPDHPWA
mmetsp:Transcript_51313/g.115383  ORF Transcript_51313/g.115383 Transcript_51313/m.115383 type:complete len:211 (+) Transcript_51313:124-756(+)